MSGSSLGGEKPGAGCSTLRGTLAGHHLVVVLLGAHQPATTTPPPILARTPFLPRVSTLSVGAPFQQLPIILGLTCWIWKKYLFSNRVLGIKTEVVE